MTTTRIERIHAREVLDSRGRPTVEVEVTCSGARPGRAIVPSGASTGTFEALELRDSGDRYDGYGVQTAVRQALAIGPQFVGQDASEQSRIDATLTELTKAWPTSPYASNAGERLGANATLGISLAVAYAAAEAQSIPLVEHLHQLWQQVFKAANAALLNQGMATSLLGRKPFMPLPMVNMISGGKHAGGNLDFQDYLIMPLGAKSYPQALEWIVRIYWRLGKLLTKSGYEGVLVGDEGGYGPKLKSNEEALNFVTEAISAAGLTPGKDVAIALDVASSHFFRDGTYRLAATGDQQLQAGDVIDLLEGWVDRYPILSIEDGLAEDDWLGWQKLTQRLGHRVQLIGDDLFVTNTERLREGVEKKVANSVLVKVNQIGTLSGAMDAMRLALESDYRPVISARSGETEDATIADLAVATGAGQIKIGSIARSERLAKYNQLLRLAENSEFPYYGRAIFRESKLS